ncbi:MAG: hypothetical protein GY795_20410 [Desulfobacterales bacterium]|nr:hypothetical protein [Desulfobacterales bacterium]
MLKPKYIVYDDEVISVGLNIENTDADERDLIQLTIRWLKPKSYKKKDGTIAEITNIMGGETSWFILPHSFGVAVGKKLVEQKTAGLSGFQEDGFNRMVKWLVEMEHLDDSMCY